MMAGVLNGAAFGSDVVDFTSDTTSKTNTGQVVMALDPAGFGMGDTFAREAARVFAEMRASDPLPGHDPVRLPGDGKTAAATSRRADGLALTPAFRKDLDALAEAYGLRALCPLRVRLRSRTIMPQHCRSRRPSHSASWPIMGASDDARLPQTGARFVAPCRSSQKLCRRTPYAPASCCGAPPGTTRPNALGRACLADPGCDGVLGQCHRTVFPVKRDTVSAQP